MNRRDFGRMVVGSGLAAGLPAQGIAGAIGTQTHRSKYVFAVALAHARTDVSAEMISEMFGVRPRTARSYIAKMVKHGVVDAPNAEGIARLSEPLQRIVPQIVEYNPTGGYIVKGPASAIREKAAELAKEALELDPEPTQNAKIDDPEAISLSDADRAPPEVSDAARSAE